MRDVELRRPLTLVGKHVELVPLDPSHAAALSEAGRDPAIMAYMRTGPGFTPKETEAVIALLLGRQSAGTDLCFTIRQLPSHRPVGMTRYLRIDRSNRSLEIGGTWFDSKFWRTPYNTEAKYLMLVHAFDTEGIRRVQIQTDSRNTRSQRAIERLGAVREGMLREDVLLSSGIWRSSVFYSILESEWPAVRRNLEEKLARPWTPSD